MQYLEPIKFFGLGEVPVTFIIRATQDERGAASINGPLDIQGDVVVSMQIVYRVIF